MTFKIIGVSGKLGTGKDYVVENFIVPYLHSKGLSTSIVAFADQIKINAATQNNLPIMEMYGDKTPEIRKMLQIAGTEEGRNKFGEDIWIRYLQNLITLRSLRDKIDVFIITDCRFLNEAEWIKQDSGLLIRINAPDRNSQRLNNESHGDPELRIMISKHPSEISLDDYVFSHVIDNSIPNVDHVKEKVLEILKSL